MKGGLVVRHLTYEDLCIVYPTMHFAYDCGYRLHIVIYFSKYTSRILTIIPNAVAPIPCIRICTLAYRGMNPISLGTGINTCNSEWLHYAMCWKLATAASN